MMKCLFLVLASLVNLLQFLITRTNGFVPQTTYYEKPTRHNNFSRSRSAVDDDPTSTAGQWIMYEDIPTEFTPLLTAVTETCIPRAAKTDQQAHDAFRYEWGTWVDEEKLSFLMDRVNEVRLQSGAYTKLVNLQNQEDSVIARRYRVAGGQDWDILLHVIPEGKEWRGTWVPGSWTIVKPLTGVIEVAMLRGPNAQGMYRKASTKSLRGGADGSLAGSKTTAGDDATKYLGGPLRSYTGKAAKPTLLEVVLRPPIFADDSTTDNGVVEDLPFSMDEVLAIEIALEDDGLADEVDKENINDGSMKEVSAGKKFSSLTSKIGMEFDQVGGLDDQLNDIARRVLASRANPEAARRLGISHVKGILLSGPPGCGKTLLARELARLLGAREPQIVNGPEILDKYIGEAEKRVRELFYPAEQEYALAGDDSALHMIILDEMDAIARKRGSMTADTTGVRDSVVNQLLSKMDGVKQASNILVVGLTNRPELLDPALLRPGRLEVQLKIELPDRLGRRDILRIHTRQMREADAISQDALNFVEDTTENGLASRLEHYSGAEIAGVVRSAASFALARSAMTEDKSDNDGIVTFDDLLNAIKEVRPAMGKQDDLLHARYPHGISICSTGMERITRDLKRFIIPLPSSGTTRLSSLLLVGVDKGGAGSTALAAWAAAEASSRNYAEYVRFITALDLLTVEGSGEEARAAALVDKFTEAQESKTSLLVLDDVDQLCAGIGPDGYSSVMLATLRALLRCPPRSQTRSRVEEGTTLALGTSTGKSMQVIAVTSRSDAACRTLNEIFDETLVVPLLETNQEVSKLLSDCALTELIVNKEEMAKMLLDRMGGFIGCKTAIRLVERAVAGPPRSYAKANGDSEKAAGQQLQQLKQILDDLRNDQISVSSLCNI